jgi:hypothetical protein
VNVVNNQIPSDVEQQSSDPSACGFADPSNRLATGLQIFQGDANPAQARIYASMPLAKVQIAADPTNLKLSGRLIGPHCEFAHTLPARIPFADRSGEQMLLAEAVVPDPCFWTPDVPFLYRAQVELLQGETPIASCEKTVGLRRLGARGKFLHFDGQRFVLRGMGVRPMGNGEWGMGNEESINENYAQFAKDTWTALVCSRPNHQLCEFASRRGVLLIADLTASQSQSAAAIADQLRQLAPWPAVSLALLPANQNVSVDVRHAARNLLLAGYVPIDEPLVAAPWMDMTFIEVETTADFARKISGCGIPVVAVRRLSAPTPIETARAACDQLQSDLAAIGDFAGYIV